MSDQSTTTFDPELFEQQTYDERTEDQRVVVPEGDYTALIDSYKFETANTKNGPKPVCNVQFHITDERAVEATGLEKTMCRATLWLDLTEDGSALEFGPNKNVFLGKIRTACGQNEPGVPWTFKNLIGAGPVIVKVKNRRDPNDPEKIYDEVAGVAAA